MPVLRLGHLCLKGVVTYLGQVDLDDILITRGITESGFSKHLMKALMCLRFRNITPTCSTIPRLQEVEDLQGDDLLYCDAEMELMNIILLSIPNEIYNFVDSCKTDKEMWARVERLMRGTIQNQVDRETRFTNEFDQFVTEPGESLVSVYNCFAQLMNDLERNNMKFPTVSINTKFLNSLQPEWLKYVTQVRLAMQLTVDSFDDLFYYLSQYEKLVNASIAKKLEKSHDPLALVAHTSSSSRTSSRNTSSYYVTHPSSVVDYDEEYQQDDVHNHSEDPLASAMVNIQSRNSSNIGRNNRRAYVQEEVVEGMNALNETGNVQRALRTPTSGNTSTVQCYNCSGKGHYARNCPKPRNDFLFADASRMEEIEELSANICLMARIQPTDQNSDDGTSYESALISENPNKRNQILENITKDNNYLNEFLEADERAKHFHKQAQSQLIRDRDIIRDLEKQRDTLNLEVKNYKRKNEELQQTHSILKRKMSENEDNYHDTILDLEAKLKKNVDLILKLGNSLQGMFMLGPKPLSVYDQQLKHGLGYPNPYTLKQAISECPKLYVATRAGDIEIPLNVRDSEETLEDAFKSQQKMNEKMNDPIAVANKQNCWTIDYKQLNALYKEFVPQKELSAEQTYFSSFSIPSVKIQETKTMPSELPLINVLYNIKVNDFCQDQVKPIFNELQVYLDAFQNLFQRDIKEMKDVFEQNDVYLDEIERQNNLLKDQLLEASLKHDIKL
ncbi:integrase, catalytic region, zinc finger, CCHC-type containing protein, partial [Tanacetum coccineum]